MLAANDPEHHVPQLDKVPACPERLAQLIRSVQDPDHTAADLAQFIEEDAAFNKRVLRLLNSSLFVLSRPVKSVEQAVFRVGVPELWTLALVLLSCDFMKRHAAALRVGHEPLWEHALRVAALARSLATRSKEQEADKLFAAAALHDIGKLALCCHAPEAYVNASKGGRVFGPAAVQAEETALGIGHAELGGCLLAAWAIPEAIVALVRGHHDPVTDGAVDLRTAALAAADALAHAATREMPNLASGLIRMDYSDDLLTEPVASALRLDGAACISVTAEAMQVYEELVGTLT